MSLENVFFIYYFNLDLSTATITIILIFVNITTTNIVVDVTTVFLCNVNSMIILQIKSLQQQQKKDMFKWLWYLQKPVNTEHTPSPYGKQPYSS